MFSNSKMQKIFRQNDSNLFPYKDIHQLLYGKSKYFKNLEKKKNDSYNLINTQKIEIIKDKLLRSNRFERNYALFSKNNLELKPSITQTQKIYFSPDIKPLFLSAEEEVYPNRYKKKKFDIDNFSLIYKVTNSSNYSEQKPIKLLNTSAYFKMKEKRKKEEKNIYKGNKNKDFEDRKNIDFSNYSNIFNNSNVINKSNLSNYNSSFLTSVRNNVIINREKKSN